MLILVAAVTAVMGYGTGAPPAACVTITPDHGTSRAVGPVPYIVNISSLDDGYTPGETYTSEPQYWLAQWYIHNM